MCQFLLLKITWKTFDTSIYKALRVVLYVMFLMFNLIFNFTRICMHNFVLIGQAICLNVSGSQLFVGLVLVSSKDWKRKYNSLTIFLSSLCYFNMYFKNILGYWAISRDDTWKYNYFFIAKFPGVGQCMHINFELNPSFVVEECSRGQLKGSDIREHLPPLHFFHTTPSPWLYIFSSNFYRILLPSISVCSISHILSPIIFSLLSRFLHMP